LYILYHKDDRYILGCLSSLEKVQEALESSPVMSKSLEYVEMEAELLPPKHLSNYKFVDGQIIELTYEDRIDKEEKMNLTITIKRLEEEKAQLQQENIQMMLAITGLYEMMAGGNS
jgi:hypothetical protein